MSTTVTTHSTSVHVSMKGSISSHASETSGDTAAVSPHTSRSLPASPVSMASMSGLLNSRNLVQDEKLVVATLATLDSGNPSHLIKQDLKWIIQSRRKAEGKAELQVEFKKPVKEEQLTLEELTKRARRRELNRLAARRSREKGQKRKDMLVEEIRKLQTENSELFLLLDGLTEQRNRIIDTLRQHMKQCSDYKATQNAAVGMSQRVLEMLGFPVSSSRHQDIPGVSTLYISTGEDPDTPTQHMSPALVIKNEHYSPYSSCGLSPMVVGLSGKVLHAEGPAINTMDTPTIKIEESPPPLSTCEYQVIGSIPSSPQPSSSQLSSFDSPHLPAPRAAIPKRRSSMHGVEESTEDEEVFQYKHKLMKHRKQSSVDPPKVTKSAQFPLSSTGVRSSRVMLERSFSFPCTRSETWSTSDSCLQSPLPPDLGYSDSTVSHKYFEEHQTTALPIGNKSETPDTPLDLVVKKDSNMSETDFEKHYRIGQTDTWPPGGARFGPAGVRGIERRWSVDDHHSLPEPLNLSKEVSSEDDISLSPTNSSSGDPCHYGKTRTKYSSHTVDPYR